MDPTLMLIVGLIAGGVIGAITSGVAVQQVMAARLSATNFEAQQLQNRAEELARQASADLDKAERRRIAELEAAETRRQGELSEARQQHAREVQKQKEAASEILAAERKSSQETAKGLANRLEDLRRDEQRLKDSFKALAQDSLDANRGKFLLEANARLEPLVDIQTKLQSEVRALETKREVAYRDLLQRAEQLQAETSKLSNTLANPQTRGSWGELKLERVIELAGLTQHVDFDTQVQVKFERETLRPDVVVHLPGKRKFPIDAKVPLTSFLQAIEEADDSARVGHFANHVAAVRARIKELGDKAYFRAFDSPDFVVMFIPIEAAYVAAMEADADLIDYAIQQNRVILCGPLTLMSLLVSVAYGWKEIKLVEGAREIAKLGRELVDRASVVRDHAVEMKSGLEKAAEAGNQLINSLESRLLVTARRFQKLGAGAGDEIPPVGEILLPLQLSVKNGEVGILTRQDGQP